MAKTATLTKYENITSGEIFYGFKFKDALIKDVAGEKYMEVTPSVLRPRQMWIKLDSLRPIGQITFDKPGSK